MPSITTSSAPGIAPAVASPPESVISGSSRPWITTVGTRHLRQLLGAVARRENREQLALEAVRIVGAVVCGLGSPAQELLVERKAGRSDRLERLDVELDVTVAVRGRRREQAQRAPPDAPGQRPDRRWST